MTGVKMFTELPQKNKKKNGLFQSPTTSMWKSLNILVLFEIFFGILQIQVFDCNLSIHKNDWTIHNLTL